MGWGTSRGGPRCFDLLHVKQMTFICGHTGIYDSVVCVDCTLP